MRVLLLMERKQHWSEQWGWSNYLTGKLQANQTVLYPNTLTTSIHLSISHLACVVANKLEYGFCARIHNTMRM